MRVLYSAKLLMGKNFEGKTFKEKTFTNFEVLWLFGKVLSVKFVDVAFLVAATSESFLRENFDFHQLMKVFCHESFLLCDYLKYKSKIISASQFDYIIML